MIYLIASVSYFSSPRSTFHCLMSVYQTTSQSTLGLLKADTKDYAFDQSEIPSKLGLVGCFVMRGM